VGRRIFSTSLAAYLLVWLNVVLPGHKRGIVTLPGASADSCCRDTSTSASAKRNHPPTSKDRANCALCFFAARVTPPPVAGFDIAPPSLVHLLPIPAPEVVQLIPHPRAYHGRAPPALHFA